MTGADSQSRRPVIRGIRRLRVEARVASKRLLFASLEPMLRFELLTADGVSVRVQEELVNLVPGNVFDPRNIGEA